jgi:hypothetical protein
MQLILPKTYHASCYPRSGFSTNRLIAHSDIAMVNDYFAQSTSHWQDRLARSVEDGEVSRKALSSGPETLVLYRMRPTVSVSVVWVLRGASDTAV